MIPSLHVVYEERNLEIGHEPHLGKNTLSELVQEGKNGNLKSHV